MDTLGWIGGIMLAICALPQAYMAWKQGHSNGVSALLLILWGGGEIFTFIYVLPKSDLPLLLNYSTNLVSLFIISWFKLFPRKKEDNSNTFLVNK